MVQHLLFSISREQQFKYLAVNLTNATVVIKKAQRHLYILKRAGLNTNILRFFWNVS